MNTSLVLALLCACVPLVYGQAGDCSPKQAQDFKDDTKKYVDAGLVTKDKGNALLACLQENGRWTKKSLESCNVKDNGDGQLFSKTIKDSKYSDIFCCVLKKDMETTSALGDSDNVRKIDMKCKEKVFPFKCTEKEVKQFRGVFADCDKTTDSQAADSFACMRRNNFVNQETIDESVKENKLDSDNSFQEMGCKDSAEFTANVCSMMTKGVRREPKYLDEKKRNQMLKSCKASSKPGNCKPSDFLAPFNTIMEICSDGGLTDEQYKDWMKCMQDSGMMAPANLDECNFKSYNEFSNDTARKEMLCDFQEGRNYWTCVCNEDTTKKPSLKPLKARRDISEKCAMKVFGSKGVPDDKEVAAIFKIFKEHCGQYDEASGSRIFMDCSPKGVYTYEAIMFCYNALGHPVTNYGAMYNVSCDNSIDFGDWYKCCVVYDFYTTGKKMSSQERINTTRGCISTGFPPDVPTNEVPEIVAYYEKDVCPQLQKNATDEVNKCLGNNMFVNPEDVKTCSEKFKEKHAGVVQLLCSKSKKKKEILSCILNKALQRNPVYADENERRDTFIQCGAYYIPFVCNNKLAEELVKANPEIANYTEEISKEILDCYDEINYITMKNLKECNTKNKVDLSSELAFFKALISPTKECQDMLCCGMKKVTDKDASYKSAPGRDYAREYCEEEKKKKK